MFHSILLYRPIKLFIYGYNKYFWGNSFDECQKKDVIIVPDAWKSTNSLQVILSYSFAILTIFQNWKPDQNQVSPSCKLLNHWPIDESVIFYQYPTLAFMIKNNYCISEICTKFLCFLALGLLLLQPLMVNWYTVPSSQELQLLFRMFKNNL